MLHRYGNCKHSHNHSASRFDEQLHRGAIPRVAPSERAHLCCNGLATSGRTTLGGEGLQHQDGTSHLIASTIPNCKAYDPAFAGELAVIIDHGMREMLVDQKDVFYYITMMNESYAQPNLPAKAHQDVIRGCYKFNTYLSPSDQLQAGNGQQQVTLLGSGAILLEVIKAAQQLVLQGISVTVFSVTSWSELSREGQVCHQQGHHGVADESAPFLTRMLGDSAGPIVAATDYVRAVPESVRSLVPDGRSYLTLGTDGFGRSDTRAALRAFFGVDAASIAQAAMTQLARG